jgi:serine protease AprX
VYESYKLDPLCQAVEQAWKNGIVVIVAAGNYGRDDDAGNNGYGTITAPGNDPYAITVGAMNTMGTADRTDDVIASYSSKGPTLFDHVIKPDLVAPGNLIISLYTPGETLSQQNPGNEIPTSLYQTSGSSASSGTYFILSGTSMAAPMVSGATALMLQRNPSLTPDQVKARLMKTAFKNLIQASVVTDPVTGQTFYEQADVFTVGAGYLDVQAALSNSDLAPAMAGSALSPTATINSQGSVGKLRSMGQQRQRAIGTLGKQFLGGQQRSLGFKRARERQRTLGLWRGFWGCGQRICRRRTMKQASMQRRGSGRALSSCVRRLF